MKKCLLGLLTLISFLANGQYKAEEFEAALLQAKYGALLVYNGQTNSFSLKIESKSVDPTDKPNFIRVDNILMQLSITPFTQELDFKNLDNETQKKFLTGWKSYEKKWVEEQLKIRLTEKADFVEISNKPFLYWTYDMPKSKNKDSVDKQVYIVTICFDQLLILSGPVEKGKEEETIQEKFLTIAKTLTLYPNQTQDLEKLYNELKRR
jgi:hypothetical protein